MTLFLGRNEEVGSMLSAGPAAVDGCGVKNGLRDSNLTIRNVQHCCVRGPGDVAPSASTGEKVRGLITTGHGVDSLDHHRVLIGSWFNGSIRNIVRALLKVQPINAVFVMKERSICQ